MKLIENNPLNRRRQEMTVSPWSLINHRNPVTDPTIRESGSLNLILLDSPILVRPVQLQWRLNRLSNLPSNLKCLILASFLGFRSCAPPTRQENLPLALLLILFNNPAHISDVIDKPAPEEEIDMELETKIEQYMFHLVEEQDVLLEAQNELATKDPKSSSPICSQHLEVQEALPTSSINEVPGQLVDHLPLIPFSTSHIPLNPSASFSGPLEPTSITLELFGISFHQGKKFAFADDSDEIDDDSPQKPAIARDDEFDNGPSQHEEEAFEEAQTVLTGPTR